MSGNKSKNWHTLIAFLFAPFALLLLNPFEQPILLDRSYLLYMSQVVARGDSLYHHTTFGYTPLAVLIVGYWLKFWSWLGIGNVVSARIAALLLFGLCNSVLFNLIRDYFKSTFPAILASIFFVGFGTVSTVFMVNAEPKLFVLLFSLLAFKSIYKTNFGWAGFWFCTAIMCWHWALLSSIALFVGLLFLERSSDKKKQLIKMVGGSTLALLPVLVYLIFSDAFIPFWDQTVGRKIAYEGSKAGTTPFYWIRFSIAANILEIHLMLAFLGGLMIYVFQSLKRGVFVRGSFFQKFLLLYTVLWSIGNTIEFQGYLDIAPFLPVLIFFASYFAMESLAFLNKKWLYPIGLLLAFSFSFYDYFKFIRPYNYSDQLAFIKKISEHVKTPLPIGFESFYVVQERALPTHFVRFQGYEDYFLFQQNACDSVMKKFEEGVIDGFILRYGKDASEAGSCAQSLLKKYGHDEVILCDTIRKKVDLVGRGREIKICVFKTKDKKKPVAK